MPGLNLTRAEAADRAAIVAVDAYTVHLDLTGAATDPTYRSSTTITFRAGQGASTWLDLQAPTVLSVRLNDQDLDPLDVVAEHRIQLVDLVEHNTVTVVAECAYMNTGEGLHRFTDPVDGEVFCYTQFEVADARRVFACFEQPDLKATFTLTVDAPSHWTVVSNEVGAAEPLGEGKARWRFATTGRLSTYVTAVCAGPYHAVRDTYEGSAATIPLGLLCRPSIADHLDAEDLFEVTKQGFAFFEDAFGRAYPFSKYDQVFVPEFNAGAMENAGCVTYRDEYLFRSRVTDAALERRAETVLHEMAHMWFGDLVTMRWWDDLWLNESFATWASVLAQAEATRWTHAWTTFATAEKLWALRQDQLPSTHPISADMRDLEDVEVNFDGITYAKGASVLKQLVAWVGRDAFLAGLRDYFDKHAWGNTTLADLFAELEARSGRDLQDWEHQWLQTAGVNVLRPVVDVAEDGTFRSVTVVQEAPEEHPRLRAHRLGIGLYDRDESGRLHRRDSVHVDLSGERNEIEALRGVRVPDLLLVNDEDLTFARVRLDERSLATAIESIASFSESLPRALVWTATTDMLRSAELAATDYAALLLAGLAAEDDLMVVQTLLLSGRGAVELYSAPSNRVQLRTRWTDGLRRLAGEAAAGSDHQLAFVRAWASAAHSAADLAEVQALLRSEPPASGAFEGLALDADLRWHLLQRLVVHGAAGDAEIDAELARDATASGQNQAVLARAARPWDEAKEATFQALLAPKPMANRDLEMALAGFVLPEQADVLAPFVDRYFAAVPDLWRTRTLKTAERLVTGLFPRVLPTPALARRAWRAAEEAASAPALARLLSEGAADLDRALAAQAFDEERATPR